MVDAPHARELIVARGEHEPAGGIEAERAHGLGVPARIAIAIIARGGHLLRGDLLRLVVVVGGGGGGCRRFRGGRGGGVGVRRVLGDEPRGAVALEVVHAHDRAEGDGDEVAGGVHRDQRRGGGPSAAVVAPVLAGAAAPGAGIVRRAAALLEVVPVPLASHGGSAPRTERRARPGARARGGGGEARGGRGARERLRPARAADHGEDDAVCVPEQKCLTEKPVSRSTMIRAGLQSVMTSSREDARVNVGGRTLPFRSETKKRVRCFRFASQAAGASRTASESGRRREGDPSARAGIFGDRRSVGGARSSVRAR